MDGWGAWAGWLRGGLDSTGAFGSTPAPETPDPPDAAPEPAAPEPAVGLNECCVVLPGRALATAAERTPPATMAPMAK
jgi:hypothetical protein